MKLSALLLVFLAASLSHFEVIHSQSASLSTFITEVYELLENPATGPVVRQILNSVELAAVPSSPVLISQLINSSFDGVEAHDIQVLYVIFQSLIGELVPAGEPAGSANTPSGGVTNDLEILQAAFENALTPEPAATPEALSYYVDNTPAAIRLALVPGGMAVSWQTFLPYATPPVVMFGSKPNEMYFFAFGTSRTYGTAYFHDVVIEFLEANTKYYYTIVTHPAFFPFLSAGTPAMSFTTAIAAGTATPHNVTLVGDMGTYNAGDTYASMLRLVNSSHLFLHIGDLSYADDAYLRPEAVGDNTYEDSWNSWQEWLEPITSAVPYMVLPGNHESTCQELTGAAACPPNQRNFTAYRNRFRMPSEESHAGNVQSMWSSFNFGLVHYVLLDTETDFSDAPEGPTTKLAGGPFGGAGTGNPSLLSWLKSDLKGVNRAVTPWLVVLGHRPLYASVNTVTNIALLEAFENLFLEYKVDFYICGHLHYYERLYPIAHGIPEKYSGNVYTNPSYPVYLINGAAGNDEGHSTGGQNSTISAILDETHYGYSRLQIYNKTHFEWQFFASDTQQLIDNLWVVKSA